MNFLYLLCFFLTVSAAINFGVWVQNVNAGVFMFCLLTFPTTFGAWLIAERREP